MWENLLYSIVNGTFTAFVAYTTKKENNNSRAEINLLKANVAKCMNDIEVLKDGDKETKDTHNFRMGIKNSIIENANLKINDFDKTFNNIPVASALTEYFKEISEFALMFFYSGLRNNDNISEKDFSSHLNISLSAIMYKLTTVLQTEVPETKAIMHGNSLIEIDFLSFFGTNDDSKRKEPDCFSRNKILLMRLIKNNIDEIELKKIFVAYITDFMELFRDRYSRFSKLKNYEIELNKILK